MCAKRNEEGFALVLVLWALLLLSVLGSSFLIEARATRTIADTSITELKARMLADGAINRAIMALLDSRDPLHLPLDGTARKIELFGQKILLSCESETGKVDLNAAPSSLLLSLFRGQGLATEEAEALVAQIVAWRSPLRSSSPEPVLAQYREAGRPYGPRFGMFRAVGELRLVLGMTGALQATVAPLITVWSTTGVVDRSVAGEGLLRVLEAAHDGLAAGQLAARRAGQAAGADRPPTLGEVVTIRAKVEMEKMTVQRTAAVQIAGDRREPYRVLAWQ